MLFCADLKKFQKLKETPKTKHLQKEESDKEGIRIAGKKSKIKEEAKLMKTKSARHRKWNLSVSKWVETLPSLVSVCFYIKDMI